MSTRFLPFTVLGLLALALPLFAADDKVEPADDSPVVEKLDVALGGNFRQRGRATEPTRVDSADALEKALDNEKAHESIAKQVDFAKQDVLIFRWAGSGGDGLKPAIVKEGPKTTVRFDYRRGLTRDLRPHSYVYAIAKGTKFTVEVVPFRRGR